MEANGTQEACKGISWPEKILIAALIIQTLGYVGDTWMFSGPMNSVFFLNLDMGDAASRWLEKAIAVACGALIIGGITARSGRALSLATFALAALPLSVILNHSSFGFEFSFMTSATRITLPLALGLLLTGETAKGERVLKAGLGLTFIFHGIEALQLKPEFVDYMIEAWDFMFGARLRESDANKLLYGIGVMDIACGYLAMTRPTLKLLAHMAMWGAATAAIRYVAKGDNGIPQTLLRAGHAGVPLYFAVKLIQVSKFKLPSLPLVEKATRGKA